MARRKSQITGMAELRAALKELPPSIEGKVAQRATNAGARVLLQAVKASAPVGKEPSRMSARYGRLKMNLRLQQLRRVPAGSRGTRVWTRFAFWGYFLEFGTRHQAARPWFRPAVDSAQDAAQKALAAAMGDGILREVARLATKLGVK